MADEYSPFTVEDPDEGTGGEHPDIRQLRAAYKKLDKDRKETQRQLARAEEERAELRSAVRSAEATAVFAKIGASEKWLPFYLESNPGGEITEESARQFLEEHELLPESRSIDSEKPVEEEPWPSAAVPQFYAPPPSGEPPLPAFLTLSEWKVLYSKDPHRALQVFKDQGEQFSPEEGGPPPLRVRQ